MAVRTSSQSGNTHSSPFAFGTTVNNGDILLKGNAAHAIVIDANCTLGISLCTTYQSPPTRSAVGSSGALPAGAYRVRVAAVGSTGIATASAGSLALTITFLQSIRVVVPALTPGASSYNVYITNTGGGAGTEKLYATGVAPGNYDCSSALWMDGTTTYAAADGLPTGDAITVASGVTTDSGGWSLASNVLLTAKGDISHLGNWQTNDGAGVEYDATSSPSGLAVYHRYFGTVNSAGTPKLIMRGTSSSRAFERSKAGTTPAHMKEAVQTSNSSDVRLDAQWAKFKLLGDATNPACSLKNAGTFNQLQSDVIWDSDCRSVSYSSTPAASGWIENNVSYYQTAGNTYNSVECCVAYQVATNADVTSGTRTVNVAVYKNLPAAMSRGGATYTGCVYGWHFTNTTSTGTAASKVTINTSFFRKPYGGNAVPLQGDMTDFYLLIDYAINAGNATLWPSGDFNPHGFALQNSTLGTMTYLRGTYEYNGSDDSGDMNKSPVGSTCRTDLLYLLGVPNTAGKTPGSILTNSTNNSTYTFRIQHPTWCTGGRYGVAVQEGSSGTGAGADQIPFTEDGFYFSPSTSVTVREVCGDSRAVGLRNADICSPAGVRNNIYFNLSTTNDIPNGIWAPHTQKFTVQPDSGSIVLTPQTGTVADLATNGPKFFAPNRNFATWADTLGATGTLAQRTQYGLDRLFAIADTTDANHISGLTALSPSTYVRAGFAPTNALFRNADHTGLLTVGAIDGIFSSVAVIQQHRMKQGMM